MNRSVQQERAIRTVVDAVMRTDQGSTQQHVVLEAVAGAGKTYTLLEMVREVREVRPTARILMLAFNVDPGDAHAWSSPSVMARQLQERLEYADVDVFTFHSFGLRMLLEAEENDERPAKRPHTRLPRVDPDKAYRAWRQCVGEGRPAREWTSVRAAIDRHRQDGEDPPPALASDADPSKEEEKESVVRRVLRMMATDRTSVDQEDQIYHPVVYALRLPVPYNLVLVDESQGAGRV